MRLSRMIGNILGFSRDRPREGPFDAHGSPPGSARPSPRTLPASPSRPLPPRLTLVGDRDVFRQVADNLAGATPSAAMGGKAASRYPGCAGGKADRALRLLFRIPGPASPRKSIAALRALRIRLPAGTGLGLSIVSSLCERSGWSIRCAPTPRTAAAPTCFAVEIPRQASASDTTDRPRSGPCGES